MSEWIMDSAGVYTPATLRGPGCGNDNVGRQKPFFHPIFGERLAVVLHRLYCADAKAAGLEQRPGGDADFGVKPGHRLTPRQSFDMGEQRTADAAALEIRVHEQKIDKTIGCQVAETG